MAREVICGIYKITNLVNGKIYIGQSKNIYKRWSEHKRPRNYNCPLLYKAIKKYGIDNFSFEIQEICSEEELNEKEIYWIKYYNSCVFFENGFGYNCNEGGSEGKGYVFSEETREKMSEIKLEKGVWCSKPVICENIEFNSISDCAKYYGADKDSMSCWLNKKYGMPEFFVKNRLRYKDDDFSYKERKIKRARRNVRICLDGKTFDSMRDCAKYLNTNTTMLGYWLEVSMPKELYNRGLKYFDKKYRTTTKISENCPTKSHNKEIIFNGNVYKTLNELGEAIGCHPSTIARFIKTKSVPAKLENAEFIFNGEKFDTVPKKKNIKVTKTSRWMPVYFDGTIYDSIQELANKLDKPRNTVKYWFDKNKLPKEYGDTEFYYLKGGENGCEKK